LRALKFPSEDESITEFNKRLAAAEAKFNPDTEEEPRWSSEKWYQELRKRWYFHPRSWYMIQASMPRKLTSEEIKISCNGFNGCVQQCRFFPPEGRIEPEELVRIIESLEKYIEWKNTPCNPETCRMHPDHNKENNNTNDNK